MVDAAVTDLTTHQIVGTQQFVLFWGASPFVYAGFTGRCALSDHYSVTLTVGACRRPCTAFPNPARAGTSGCPAGQRAGSGEPHEPPVPRLRLRPRHVRPVHFRPP